MILRGKCGVKIPNPVIRGWREHRDKFQELCTWHETTYTREIERVKCIFRKNFELPLPEAALEKVYSEMLADHMKQLKLDYIERSKELGQEDKRGLSGIWKAIPDIINKNMAGYNAMKGEEAVPDENIVDSRASLVEAAPVKAWGPFQFLDHLELTDDDISKIILLEKYHRFEWFVEVVELQPGHSFGELALLSDKPRAATVRCLTDCTLAVIGRHDYQRLLQKIEQKHIEERIQFFWQLPFLSHWPKRQVEKVIYSYVEQ